MNTINDMNVQKISIINVGNPFASHFGLTPLALPEEEWPQFYERQMLSLDKVDPKNLFFICQLNLTEAPYVPEILSDVKLITIFVHHDFIKTEYLSIRAYKSLEGLAPLYVPQGATFPRGF